MRMYRLLVLGVVVSVLLVLTGGTPAQAQERIVRQVTVIGNGEAVAIPDTAYVQIGVETEAPSAQDALAQNNAQVAAVIESIQGFGIPETDIKTSSFSIYPRYDRDARQVLGYVVRNMVQVTIRNLSQAGALLDQVVQLGANRVYGVYFSVDDPSVVLDQARSEAMADARRKAEQLAALAGAQLGPVLVITENIGAPVDVPVVAAPDEIEAAPSREVPIEPGEQQYTVRLQVSFELL